MWQSSTALANSISNVGQMFVDGNLATMMASRWQVTTLPPKEDLKQKLGLSSIALPYGSTLGIVIFDVIKDEDYGEMLLKE